MADGGVPGAGQLLFEDAEWDFETLQRTTLGIERIAFDELKLDVFPNQIEIISSEQMLDAYSSVGMPLMYRHWSFGKQFIHHERLYRKGARGLAYEIVINSDPCVCYCLEENTMALQALVIAHAAFGHNHFFKNNHLFRQWTDPGGILDYLDYARTYMRAAEERHGKREVEAILDAAHALMSVGVFRHRRPPGLTMREEQERARRRQEEEERSANYLLDSFRRPEVEAGAEANRGETRLDAHLPEENILYFLERHSPILAPWQREVLRIVRNIAQYFYPQKQTQVMNEGCATFTHFYIMNRLHETGQITDGAMLEVLHNHANVLTQPDFDDPRFSGINPYTLGFGMMRDIQRICTAPEDEDLHWFPEIAGCGDWLGVLHDAWANYRDESFIQQFLSPRLMREFKMFVLGDEASQSFYTVNGIHDEQGFLTVRDALARSRDISIAEPDIQVVDADLIGDRVLRIRHAKRDGVPLAESDREKTLDHLRTLWGYEVVLEATGA